ncbi:hypothetical protein P12x_003246 [Tundrisphaera lichenicola]|uniref:hypothetical protein n=1 Tax=Tundrisphaera lichenicola TaxID=2029860 RepID=UPI003EB8B69D
MEKPSLADRLIAPLTLLERSRGWKRRGLVFLYALIALIVGVLGWRELSLWRLPNAPEPFDLVRFGRVEVADADNAMVAYRPIFAKFGNLAPRSNQAGDKAWEVSDWSAADPEVRRWAEDHRDALTAWLPANDRTDSLLVQPEDLTMSTILEPAQNLRSYVRLAFLEGSRLEQSGDLAGAWSMYRGGLRASRHAGRHGGAIQRLIGNALLRKARVRVDAWAENPGVSTELLRQAITDVEECMAMTPPASEMVRAEYFSARDSLIRPESWRSMEEWSRESETEWINQIEVVRWGRRFLKHEPERSLRVLRLITAGYLAQCDRRSMLRPRLLASQWMIYDHDSRTPPSVRSISPQALEAWAKDSALLYIGPFNSTLQGHFDAEPGIFDHFRLRMAERAFEIEHGRPPKTYGELLGPYLKTLPEGIEPGDPANPSPG